MIGKRKIVAPIDCLKVRLGAVPVPDALGIPHMLYAVASRTKSDNAFERLRF